MFARKLWQAILLSCFIVCCAFTRANVPPVIKPTPPKKTLQYTTGWLGNTFGDDKWIQKDGIALAVYSDGTCYVPASWDENGKGVGIYKDGDTRGSLAGVSSADGAAAVDKQYVFVGIHRRLGKGPGAPIVYGIGRWHRDGTPAPWTGTTDFLPIGTQWLAGCCLAADELFVGDPATNTVRVFDRNTLQLRRTFSVAHPFRMAADDHGFLWIIQPNDPAIPAGKSVVKQYGSDGRATGKVISNVIGATALAFDPQGYLLLAGPYQQVDTYDVTRPVPRIVHQLGVKGGIYAGVSGEMADQKLMGLWGIGSDQTGAIYTLGQAPATGGGMDLRKFSPQGHLLWQLVSTQFTDCADADPISNGRDVYTRDEHFVLDVHKPLGKQWVWKGCTLDPQYDDGRVDGKADGSMFTWASPMVRRLGGRLYLYEHPGNSLGIFRQGLGEIFVPSSLIDLTPQWAKQADQKTLKATGQTFLGWPPHQPSQSRWLWRDRDGDGHMQAAEFESRADLVGEMEGIYGSWVDLRGDIWLCGSRSGVRCLWHLPLQGFDAKHNPIYHWAACQRLLLPAEFKNVSRIVYDAPQDVMYLSGTTPENPKEAHWGSLGTEVLRYDHWSKPNRSVRWRIVLPVDPANSDSFFPAMSVAGGCLFCMRRYQSQVSVYSVSDGQLLGILQPGPEVGGRTGWCDMAYGIQAVQQQDGGYLVFAEDDWHSKIIFYHLSLTRSSL